MDLNQSKSLENLAKHIDTVRELTIRLGSSAATEDSLQLLANDLKDLVTSRATIAKEQRILTSLRYKAMTSRRQNIVKAYETTFEWIFDDASGIKFGDWLRTQDGMYWISGKPGSGKSTLMKFLYNHTTTRKILEAWAKSFDLVIASFYFWSIGTPMQKSQEGLLRSLAFEILRQCPNLIPAACPRRWDLDEHLGDGTDLWELDELQYAVNQIIMKGGGHSKFCFFIDGLDEYEGHSPDIINLLDIMSKSPFIKLCVSSRPWNVFEDAYGSSDRKLYLEDLTRNDIELYVRSKLEPKLELLSLEDEGLDGLVIDIVARAQGVFLWVHLVILSLCDGLTNGDSISLLENRVRQIPTDLQKFFRHIINGVDEVYKPKMAEIFQAVLQVSEPLTLIALSFMDHEETRDPDYALYLPIGTMDRYDIGKRHPSMKRRIRRYKGLLEITTDPSAVDYFGYRVDFFHRTVHDFLQLNEIQELLREYLRPGFNAHISLCSAYLALIKTMPLQRESFNTFGPLQELLQNFMYHARETEDETGESPVDIIDELEYTIKNLAEMYRCQQLLYNDRRSDGATCHTFMEFAIYSGLRLYVSGKIKGDVDFVHRYPRSLLGSILGRVAAPQLSGATALQASEMVEFLLQRGANPNQPLGSSIVVPAPLLQFQRQNTTTVFGAYLSRLITSGTKSRILTARSRELIRERYQILEMLLQHHADPNVTFSTSKYDQPKPILGHLVVKFTNCTTSLDVHAVDFAILKALLRHGANPNAQYRDTSTVWKAYLRSLYIQRNDPFQNHQRRLIFEVTMEFIQHGADLDIYIDTPGMQYITVRSLIQKSFPRAESRLLVEAIYKRKPKRGCCARGFEFKPLLWTLKVAMDPYVPDVYRAMAWCVGLLNGNADDMDEEEGENEPLLPSRTNIPSVFTRTRVLPHPKVQVLRCSAQIDDKTYNLKIPASCLRLQYQHEESIEILAGTITLEATSLGGKIGMDSTNILYRLTFDRESVLSCRARVSHLDEGMAKKQNVIRPSKMQAGFQSRSAGHGFSQRESGDSEFSVSRANKVHAAETDTGTQAAVFELELKPATMAPEVFEHFSEVRRTGTDTKTWLRKKLASHHPLQVMDALDVALNAIQEATKLWIWIEIRDAEDANAFQTLAEHLDRHPT
jgi:hypothetical protein